MLSTMGSCECCGYCWHTILVSGLLPIVWSHWVKLTLWSSCLFRLTFKLWNGLTWMMWINKHSNLAKGLNHKGLHAICRFEHPYPFQTSSLETVNMCPFSAVSAKLVTQPLSWRRLSEFLLIPEAWSSIWKNSGSLASKACVNLEPHFLPWITSYLAATICQALGRRPGQFCPKDSLLGAGRRIGYHETSWHVFCRWTDSCCCGSRE